jgi:rhamnose transport system substrate-binding protein
MVLWSPVDLGYLTVYAAKLLAEGNLEGESIQAGRLGEIEIRGTEVLLGDPIVFDKDNIDDYDF